MQWLEGLSEDDDEFVPSRLGAYGSGVPRSLGSFLTEWQCSSQLAHVIQRKSAPRLRSRSEDDSVTPSRPRLCLERQFDPDNERRKAQHIDRRNGARQRVDREVQRVPPIQYVDERAVQREHRVATSEAQVPVFP